MIVFPAIDMRGGQVVRLTRGDPEHQKVFGNDPVAMAQKWIDEGTEWLHVVNLDGAFNQKNDNLDKVAEMAKLGAKIQFGGGIRSLENAQAAFDLGIDRVILGTLAAQQPESVAQAVERFGDEAICVGLDARGGKIVTHGWQHSTDFTLGEFGHEMVKRGAKYALFTDTNLDGRMAGVNIEDTVRLANETGLHVIASGGVTNANGISKLARTGKVYGVIVGTALYEGQIMLKEALMAAAGGSNAR